MSMLSLVFEGAVSLVLVLVALLCWRLDRRLTALKNGQDGVRRTVVELAEATQRAQASVRELRAASEEAGRALEDKIAASRALADELSILASRSADHAERSPPAQERSRGGRRQARRSEFDLVDDEAGELLDRLRGVR